MAPYRGDPPTWATVDHDGRGVGPLLRRLPRWMTASTIILFAYQCGPLGGRRSPIHLKADREGMKKYSPPRSTLNVWMSWMRRLTGCSRDR